MDNKITRNMVINQMARIHRQWVKDNGFGDNLLPGGMKLAHKASRLYVNLSSAKPMVPLGRQLASVILRAMDLAEQEGIDIDYEITSKMISNHASGNIKNRSK